MPKRRTTSLRSPLPLAAAVVLALAGGAVHAQTTSSASWASPVDDAATPVPSSAAPAATVSHTQAVTPTPSTPRMAPLPPRQVFASVSAPATAVTTTPVPDVAPQSEPGFQAHVAPSTSSQVANETYVIPSGVLLSQGLTDYAKRFGWSVRWLVADDYRVDVPLPIPPGSLASGVTYVVRTYQSQGGLLGDFPRLAEPNKTIVMQPVTAKETR